MRWWSVVFVLAACGDDGANKLADAPPAPADAAVAPAYELTGGARNVRGSRFSADVQIGHGMSQQPATAGSRRLDPNSAVKP